MADTVRSHPRPGSNLDGNIALVALPEAGNSPGAFSRGAVVPGVRPASESALPRVDGEAETQTGLIAGERTVVGDALAAPLSHGSNPNSNMAGRRREDDVNLAVVPISGDALRGEGTAKTPSPDAEGRVRLRDPGMAIGEDGDPAFSITATSPGAVATSAVRRLTPTECERLQGFPDGWTNFGPDSRRYAALGDAVTVNVSEWIGKRIMAHIERKAA